MDQNTWDDVRDLAQYITFKMYAFKRHGENHCVFKEGTPRWLLNLACDAYQVERMPSWKMKSFNYFMFYDMVSAIGYAGRLRPEQVIEHCIDPDNYRCCMAEVEAMFDIIMEGLIRQTGNVTVTPTWRDSDLIYI